MPVACQSCAPECPQAFGAQRLRGLNITTWTTSPSFARDARKCHLPCVRGGFAAAAGTGRTESPAPTETILDVGCWDENGT